MNQKGTVQAYSAALFGGLEIDHVLLGVIHVAQGLCHVFQPLDGLVEIELGSSVQIIGMAATVKAIDLALHLDGALVDAADETVGNEIRIAVDDAETDIAGTLLGHLMKPLLVVLVGQFQATARSSC